MPLNRWTGEEDSKELPKEPEKQVQPEPEPQPAPEPQPVKKVYSWSGGATVQDTESTRHPALDQPNQLEPQVHEGPMCRQHPDQPADWECERCHEPFCNPCATPPNGGLNAICPECGGLCRAVAQNAGTGSVRMTSLGTDFPSLLMDSFVYPVRGKGWVVLVWGTVFFFFLLAVAVSLGPLISLLVVFFMGCYFCSYILKIIESSSNGDEELPSPPGAMNIGEDYLLPFGKFLGTAIVSGLPLFLFMIYLGQNPEAIFNSSTKYFFYVLFYSTQIYFPMALISTSMGYFHVLNPIIIVKSIVNVFFYYLPAVVLFIVIIWIKNTGNAWIVKHLKITGVILAALISAYLTTVMLRILGLIYYANEEKFGHWHV